MAKKRSNLRRPDFRVSISNAPTLKLWQRAFDPATFRYVEEAKIVPGHGLRPTEAKIGPRGGFRHAELLNGEGRVVRTFFPGQRDRYEAVAKLLILLKFEESIRPLEQEERGLGPKRVR